MSYICTCKICHCTDFQIWSSHCNRMCQGVQRHKQSRPEIGNREGDGTAFGIQWYWRSSSLLWSGNPRRNQGLTPFGHRSKDGDLWRSQALRIPCHWKTFWMHLSAQTLGLNSPLPIFFIFNQTEVDMEFFNFNQVPPNEWKLIPMNNLHFTKWENVIFVTAPSNVMGLQ